MSLPKEYHCLFVMVTYKQTAKKTSVPLPPNIMASTSLLYAWAKSNHNILLRWLHLIKWYPSCLLCAIQFFVRRANINFSLLRALCSFRHSRFHPHENRRVAGVRICERTKSRRFHMSRSESIVRDFSDSRGRSGGLRSMETGSAIFRQRMGRRSSQVSLNFKVPRMRGRNSEKTRGGDRRRQVIALRNCTRGFVTWLAGRSNTLPDSFLYTDENILLPRKWNACACVGFRPERGGKRMALRGRRGINPSAHSRRVITW